MLAYPAVMGGPGSGGARRHSGVAPDPYALRRQRDGKEWTRLPNAGRLAGAPEWPLAVAEPSPDEMLKWREMWTMPQALIWEADRSYDLVAFYVRTYLEAMKPRAGAQARMFVRQLSNDLYLAPSALAQGRYVVMGTDEDNAIQAAIGAAASGATSASGNAKKTGARGRFTVVQPVAEPSAVEDDADDEPDEEIPF
jgi:hypothetical protein